jgi:hypothetical protein
MDVLIISKPIEKRKTIILDDSEGSQISQNIVKKVKSETLGSKFDSDLEILDASNPSTQESIRKRKRFNEFRRVFQEHWALKLPWVEPHRGKDGRNSQARCIYCSKIQERDLLLVAKIDVCENMLGEKKLQRLHILGRKRS